MNTETLVTQGTSAPPPALLQTQEIPADAGPHSRKLDMRALVPALQQTVATGGAASLLSMLMLLARCRREGQPVLRGLNAISHWLWGDRALRQDRASLRYTATGAIIHHASSLFWAALLAAATRKKAALAPPQFLPYAAATTAVAWVVDYHLTPKRLTPGFEHVISTRSRLFVYAAFAAGLALGALRNKRHG